MSRRVTSLVIITLLFISFTLALKNDHSHSHKCSHDTHNNPKPEILAVEENFPSPSQRLLASTNATYSNIRMKAYYGALNNASTAYQSYIQNQLVPPIIDYFQAALKVKYPITGSIKLPSSQATVCGGIPMPSELTLGVSNVDFYYLLVLLDDSTYDFVATTYSCYMSSGSNRPYIARTQLNAYYFSVPDAGDVLLHEENIVMLMHEITHALGFSTSLYPFFIDNNGNTLTGHIKNATLDGSPSVVLDVAPLTSRLRTYFGCSNLTGAYMENSGSSATAGSHFERRIFGFEAMTTPLIYQMQYSAFSLALLEGSGWYVPDYSYADNMWFGQGQGCNFVTGNATSSSFNNFDEFCSSSSSSQGCTNPGRGGGSCTTDMRSDGLKFYHPDVNYDCENSNATNYARLPTIQVFGRGQNSKCFTGNLSSTSDSATTTSFCFKFSCSGSGLSTQLTVKIGSSSLICNQEGIAKVTINGHMGVINCPDPLTFCSTVGSPSCPRNCMGRGTCTSGTCVCNSGYTGTDCALSS